ncbi:MAG: hypothetical protein RIC19_25410 [Phaeodactylibacter sp.]|uniref:hypothetical protein n=1 Tax=Phaeodactylibacter sp. TaxID=1940289 RepID=UPI0032EDAD85
MLNHPNDKDSFFSIIATIGNEESALAGQLVSGKSAITGVDSSWLEGVWMVHQLGAGVYGYSVAHAGSIPTVAALTESQQPVSVYRGIAIYALAEGVWAARYRNLWLCGTQSRLVEAMIGELKDQRRDWKVGSGVTIQLSNLPAFFSGLVTGGLEDWLQQIGKAEAQLELTEVGGPHLKISGHLQPWLSPGSPVPPPAAVAEYLPGAIAWCTAAPVQPLPKENPLYAHFSEWLGGHQITAQLALPGDPAGQQLLLLPVEEGDPAKTMAQLSAALGVLESYTYQMFEVRQLLGDQLFSHFVPGGFQNPYIVVLGDYVALSTSRRAVEQVMNARALGLSLLQDEAFNRCSVPVPAQSMTAWWYGNHRRSARLLEAFLLMDKVGIGAQWLEWESSLAVLYTDGAVSLESRRQSEAAAVASSLVWQLPLDQPLAAGPFLYEEGLLAQEKGTGLVCRDLEGKVRWIYPLADTLLGEPQLLYLEGGQRSALAFADRRRVHVVDWEGNPHPPYPLTLPAPAVAPLTVSALEGQVVYGIWASCEDQHLYGYDQEGRFLPGWGPNQMPDTLVPFPVQHAQHHGKDYVVALSDDRKVYLFDRLGRLRQDTLPLRAAAISPPYLLAGAEQQRIAVGQADGYVQVFNLEGQTFRLSLMPNHRGAVQFQFEDMVGDARGDYLMWDASTLRLFGYKGTDFQEVQSWSVGAPLSSVRYGARQGEGVLLGFSAATRRLWALSMNGEVLPGFPVAADAPPSILSQQGRLLALCYYEGSLYLYEL